MSLFASFIIALFVTIVLVPPLMRASGALKLVDLPTPEARIDAWSGITCMKTPVCYNFKQ